MDKTKAAKNQKLFGIAAIAFLSIGIVHVGYKALEISAHENGVCHGTSQSSLRD